MRDYYLQRSKYKACNVASKLHFCELQDSKHIWIYVFRGDTSDMEKNIGWSDCYLQGRREATHALQLHIGMCKYSYRIFSERNARLQGSCHTTLRRRHSSIYVCEPHMYLQMSSSQCSMPTLLESGISIRKYPIPIYAHANVQL